MDKEYRLDDLDRGIIALLQPDGRRSFSDIGRELGMSEGAVRLRYRRLVDDGVLQVVGVADPFKVGFGSMAIIGVSVAISQGRSIDDVAADLATFPEVSYVVMSTGAFDLLVEVMLERNEDLATFLTSRLHRVQGIARTETFMLLRVYKMSLGGWRQASGVLAGQ